MRYFFGLVLALFLSCPAGAGSLEDEAEATSFMNEYRDSVATLDPQRVSVHFNEPFMFVTAANTTVFASRSDVEVWLRPQYSRLKSKDYGRSEWTPLRVKALGSGVVIASARFIRYKIDGSELEDGGSTYLLRKTNGGWRIATQTPHPPAAALPLQ